MLVKYNRCNNYKTTYIIFGEVFSRTSFTPFSDKFYNEQGHFKHLIPFLLLALSDLKMPILTVSHTTLWKEQDGAHFL